MGGGGGGGWGGIKDDVRNIRVSTTHALGYVFRFTY